jgi:hypothetical protein
MICPPTQTHWQDMVRRNENSQPPCGATKFALKLLLVEPAFIVRVGQ